MKTTWDSVAAFMEAGGQIVGQEVNTIEGLRKYYWRVAEELFETKEAIDDVYQTDVDVVDGYADTIYAAMTALLHLAGRDKAEKIFQAVVDANTTKIDGSLGPVRRDETGKILKPEGFISPNQKIKEILRG